MANDIVAGLFGLSPYQVQQQQRAAIQQQAQAYARQQPFERAAASMYQGGAGLGMLGAQAAGMVNPEVEAARQREAQLGGVAMASPEQLRQMAANTQDPRVKMQFMQLAAQREEEAEAKKLRSLQIMKAERDLTINPKTDTTAEMKNAAAIADASGAEKGSPEWVNAFKQEMSRLTSKSHGGATPTIIQLREERERRASVNPNDPFIKDLDDAIRKENIIKPDASAITGLPQKPKGLTREASLRWDLTHDLIDQATYDLAMSGTAGGKEQTKSTLRKVDEIKSYQVLNKKFGEVENVMADSLGIPVEQLNIALTTGKGKSEEKLERAVGFIDSIVPALTQNKANILSHVERLKDLAQTGGLAELRKAGIAPGTITEREWPKFQADLANIDTSLDGKELLKQYIRIFQKIHDTRIQADELIASMKESSEAKASGGISLEDRLKKYQ